MHAGLSSPRPIGEDASERAAAGGRVIAVVVTYNPDLERLGALLLATMPQVHAAYVVDNASCCAVAPTVAAFQDAVLIPLPTNRGLGAAQNAGVAAAMQAGAEFVLILDQDSTPANDMVARLIDAYRAIVAGGQRVAALGPRVMGRSGVHPFVKIGWFGYIKLEPCDDPPWVPCDFLIASGMFISRDAWQRIGPMDEALFIDKVDTDWCLRAGAAGLVLAGVPSVVMGHKLGERSMTVLSRTGWKQASAHQPFRYYYMLRNGILLMRRPYATWRWRTADFCASAKMLVLFGVFSSDRWPMLSMMLRGVFDGLLGKTGPIDGGRSTS